MMQKVVSLSLFLLLPIIFTLGNNIALATNLDSPCVMQPNYLEIKIPLQGFHWAAKEEFSGRCEPISPKAWRNIPSKSLDVRVYANGPNGSGRYWTINISLAKKQGGHRHGICLQTSTRGWRTLQNYSRSHLPWADDLDNDGEPEILIWDSFPLGEEATLAEYGLVVWVYKIYSENSLRLDWQLTRRMATVLADEYKKPLANASQGIDDLRAKADQALRALATSQCSMQR